MRKIIVSIIICGASFITAANAQQAALVLDHVDGTIGAGPIGDSVFARKEISFWIRLTNNTGANITEIRNGFRVYSPDGAILQIVDVLPRLGDASMEPYSILWQGDDNWPPWNEMLTDNIFQGVYSIDGTGADTISWGSKSKSPGVGIPNGFDTLVYLIEIAVDASQEGLTICLDTSWIQPDGEWAWTSDTGIAGSVVPDWNGPFCWTIVNCCQGKRGNVNMDPDENVNISDLTYLVDYLFKNPNGPMPICMEEANVNADPDGTVNISDLTFLTSHLFGIPTGPDLVGCP